MHKPRCTKSFQRRIGILPPPNDNSSMSASIQTQTLHQICSTHELPTFEISGVQNGMFDGWSHFSKFPSWNPRHLGKVLKPRWLWAYSTKTTRCLLDTISCSVVAKNDKYHQISMDGAHFSKFPSWNPRHLGKEPCTNLHPGRVIVLTHSPRYLEQSSGECR